jgi:CheY-like chemotaxis protein
MALHVLVVEDDDLTRDVLRLLLQRAGCRVTTAAHGREALACLQAARPDLILLDLMMPVMSGWEFRERQRQDAALAAIPVVVLTAAADPESAAPLAAAAYLSKPVEPLDLLEAVLHHARGV